MKKKYETPVVEIIYLESPDIITTSGIVSDPLSGADNETGYGN